MPLGFGDENFNPELSQFKDQNKKLGAISNINMTTSLGLGTPYFQMVNFNNTTADQTLLEINGMDGFPGAAVVQVIAVCKTGLSSAGGCNISIGVDGVEEAFVPLTDCTTIGAGEIWLDATCDKKVEGWAGVTKKIVSDGKDLKVFIEDGKQVDSGEIHFFIMAAPLGMSQVQPAP